MKRRSKLLATATCSVRLRPAYARAHRIARLTFWSLIRDRQCASGYPNDDTCSGVAQTAWDYTRIIAGYQG